MRKRILSMLAIFVVLFFCSGTVMVHATENIDYTVTEPFIYEIVPGTSEWEALDTLDKKIDACYVPLETVTNMTTEALVETILNYPLLINIYAYNSIEIGIEAVSTYFPAIEELLTRDDAYAVLYAYSTQTSARTADSGIISIYCDTLLDYIQTASDSGISPYYVDTTVKTPNGSSVEVHYNLTWSDHRIGSYNAAYTLSQQYLSVYTSASIVGVPSPTYNCHSYAWYSQSPNSCWIDDPTLYMTDGSYSGCTATVGCKIYYEFSDSTYNHSGIISALPSNGTPAIVTSKWGALALFTHYVNDCPYADSGSSMTTSCWN